jgi:hypothetical protein
MKKITLIIVFVFGALFFPVSVNAEHLTIPVPTSELTPSPILEEKSVDYELPYPGILPGSPFYTLKVIKDGINDLLISDPKRKSNFYLLQADKRLSASIILFENGQDELGSKTLSKSLDYLEKSLEKMEEAKKEQREVLDIFGKLANSTDKQIEEIEKIRNEKNGNLSEKTAENYKRAQEIKNKVNTFRP